jgi:hypothetical protein
MSRLITGMSQERIKMITRPLMITSKVLLKTAYACASKVPCIVAKQAARLYKIHDKTLIQDFFGEL